MLWAWNRKDNLLQDSTILPVSLTLPLESLTVQAHGMPCTAQLATSSGKNLQHRVYSYS